MEYWPFASVLSVLSSCWIFESWSETAETPFSLTFTFFKSCTEVLRLPASVQTAGLLLLLLQGHWPDPGVTEMFPVSSLGHSVLIPALVGGSWATGRR